MISRGWSKAGILALVLSGWLIADGATARAQDSQEDRDPDRERGDRGRRARGGGPGGRGGGLDQRFDQASPDVGQPLPRIAAYDADGKSIELRSALEGHYSVLVFGCLT